MSKKKLALSIANIFRNIYFLTHFNYFWQWVRFLIFQINTDFLINQLTNYFLRKTPYNIPSFLKKVLFSIAETLRNIHFLTHFYYFSKWMRCALFQINTNLLLIYLNIKIFTENTWHLFLISKRNWRFPSLASFESFTFYHIFTFFNSAWDL